MLFEVYCDESRPDLLSTRRPSATYMLLGSLWLPASKRIELKGSIHRLRDRHKVGGEFKWQKVSPSRLAFYKELVDLYLQEGTQLRFRCLAVDHNDVNLKLYHEDDQELGFYKFYYQLLHHWILDFNSYQIFLDFKSTRRRDRLQTLQRCLTRSNLSSQIDTVQAVRSRESVLLQLADLLTGIAAYRLNAQETNTSAKTHLVKHFEENLGRRIGPTSRSEHKFNVFRINLRGGW